MKPDPPDVPNAKWIRLVNDRGFALVDAADFGWLNGWPWYLIRVGRNGSNDRAGFMDRGGGKPRCVLMTRFIMEPTDDQWVTTRNGNPLDCRRDNLVVTKKRTLRRIRRRAGKTCGSRFKGVYMEGSRWRVEIRVDRKRHRIGRFADEIEAAKAYNSAATRLLGSLAALNEIPETA